MNKRDTYNHNRKTLKEGRKYASLIKNMALKEALISYCDDGLLVAFGKHLYDNQTHNMENGLGYGLFHNGVLEHRSFMGQKKGKAYDTALSYLESYNAPKSGFHIVFVSGSDYSQNIEEYVRRSDGERSKIGDTLYVLIPSMNFLKMASLSHYVEKIK